MAISSLSSRPAAISALETPTPIDNESRVLLAQALPASIDPPEPDGVKPHSRPSSPGIMGFLQKASVYGGLLTLRGETPYGKYAENMAFIEESRGWQQAAAFFTALPAHPDLLLYCLNILAAVTCRDRPSSPAEATHAIGAVAHVLNQQRAPDAATHLLGLVFAYAIDRNPADHRPLFTDVLWWELGFTHFPRARSSTEATWRQEHQKFQEAFYLLLSRLLADDNGLPATYYYSLFKPPPPGHTRPTPALPPRLSLA